MANPSASLPARSLVQAVRASLKLANGSVDSLDISQLLALQHELHKTLGIIGEKLSDICSGMFLKWFNHAIGSSAYFSENQKIVIDLSDWEDGDTGDEQMVIAAESNGPSGMPLDSVPGCW